jgi:hypothetical protein
MIGDPRLIHYCHYSKIHFWLRNAGMHMVVPTMVDLCVGPLGVGKPSRVIFVGPSGVHKDQET